MPTIDIDSHDRRGLVNLIAHIEHSMTHNAASPVLADPETALCGQHRSTVLVLFDGLGTHQLGHPRGRHLTASLVGSISAPFPTTTTVSLATIATGLPASQHGLIAYQLWNPTVGAVVNTIHMTTLYGDRIDQDHRSFLPGPNLWERLTLADIESIAIQPESFDRTPLTLALYRGATFVPYLGAAQAVDRTIEAASSGQRLVLLYVPDVDFAAHVAGQDSEAYADAMSEADTIWAGLVDGLGADTLLIGTADHGHVDIAEPNKVKLTKAQQDGLILYGGPRDLFVRGDGESLAADLPGTWAPFADIAALWGPGPFHERFDERRPDGVIFADDGYAIFHSRSNNRLIGHHGGLTDEERSIPLLVRE